MGQNRDPCLTLWLWTLTLERTSEAQLGGLTRSGQGLLVWSRQAGFWLTWGSCSMCWHLATHMGAGLLRQSERPVLEGSTFLVFWALHVLFVWLFVTPRTRAYQPPLSMGFSRPEYWSGLPFLPPGDLSNPGIEPASPTSPALAGSSFTTEPPRKPPGAVNPMWLH